jgi:hypothetical protein
MSQGSIGVRINNNNNNYPGHEVSNVDCVDESGRARCHDWNMGRVRKGGESEEGYVLIGVL